MKRSVKMRDEGMLDRRADRYVGGRVLILNIQFWFQFLRFPFFLSFDSWLRFLRFVV